MFAPILFTWLSIISVGFGSHTQTEPRVVCCFKDHVVAPCYNKCMELTCENLRKGPQPCTKECEINVCQCKDGLYRNDCNECVNKEQCTKQCKPNGPIFCKKENEAVIGCHDPSKSRVCPKKHCSSPKSPFFPNETSKYNGLCILNVCDCIPGYLRNRCGKCVPEKECDRTCEICSDDPCPDPNEERRRSFADCEARTCGNLLNPKECDCNKEKCHRNKCDCKPGYSRNDCNRCVPDEECKIKAPCKCTNPCRKPKEEFSCFSECFKRTCKNLYELPIKLCLAECNYGCDCSSSQDLWLHESGECVPRSKCPPPKTKNEGTSVN